MSVPITGKPSRQNATLPSLIAAEKANKNLQRAFKTMQFAGLNYERKKYRETYFYKGVALKRLDGSLQLETSWILPLFLFMLVSIVTSRHSIKG